VSTCQKPPLVLENQRWLWSHWRYMKNAACKEGCGKFQSCHLYPDHSGVLGAKEEIL
jgi:hypothetical protein